MVFCALSGAHLYGYRVAGTGIHLLLEGQVETDVRVTTAAHGLGEVDALIERGRGGGEHAVLSAAEKTGLEAVWDALAARVADAEARSPLPAEAPNRAEIDAWLVALRRHQLADR